MKSDQMYPPLSSGGLIEAGHYRLDLRGEKCIRRFRAAASLKHVAAREVAVAVAVSAAFERRPH